jgi:hypothetical protein
LDVADLVVTSFIALVGLWLGHDLRRNQRLKVAELRVAAYGKLWALMGDARVGRGQAFDPHQSSAFSREEALDLYDKMTRWYFDEAGGMLLTNDTKNLYLAAKERLGDYALEAREGSESVGSPEVEGARRVRELSLLRTQMKYDVGILGVFFFKELTKEDREFLAIAAADATHPDWEYPDLWNARFRPWPERTMRLSWLRLRRLRRWVGKLVSRKRSPAETPGPAPTSSSLP